MAQREGQRRIDVLNDLASYRAKTGSLFGNEIIWEAVNSQACMSSPDCWWSAFAPKSHLAKGARILLSMPATSAIIERCNKAYAMQKSKQRNRLTTARAAMLSVVAYNLKIQRNSTASSKRVERRQVCIASLISARF